MKRINKIINYFFIGVSFLASKKVMVILVLALFISLLQVSTGYREEIIEMEQELFYDKGNPNISYYYDEKVLESYNDGSAISDLLNCYRSKLKEDEFSDELKKYINELNNLYNSNGAYFSFLYKDLYSGFTVSYNEEAPIFTASTIKAPGMIYLYELASRGEIDLNERLTYTSNFYSGGSGILKSKNTGTTYSVGELIEYAIHYSDNIAYAMLMNRFGRENILNFWKGLGTKQIYTLNTIWGVTSARDASIYMEELYRFSHENEEYGNKLLNLFKGAEWKLITDKNGKFNTANKGGWSGTAIHDVAIVFEKNPYILVIFSNMGEGGYMPLFNQTSKKVGLLHDEYWKYKAKVCGNIALY